MDDILAGWLIARGGRSWVRSSLNFMEPPATTAAARCAVKELAQRGHWAGYFVLCRRTLEGEVPTPHISVLLQWFEEHRDMLGVFFRCWPGFCPLVASRPIDALAHGYIHLTGHLHQPKSNQKTP
jgi:hypothetical protein